MTFLLRRFARNQSGGAFIEFAIAGPIVLMALIGCLEFGRYFWVRNSLEYAVEEAGRYAMLNRAASQGDIQTQVRNKVMGVPGTSIDVSVVAADTTYVTYKTITATYNSHVADGKPSSSLRFLTGFLPVTMMKLEASTRVPVPKG
jgi:Flp pilus assembly protein TadG